MTTTPEELQRLLAPSLRLRLAKPISTTDRKTTLEAGTIALVSLYVRDGFGDEVKVVDAADESRSVRATLVELEGAEALEAILRLPLDDRDALLGLLETALRAGWMTEPELDRLRPIREQVLAIGPADVLGETTGKVYGSAIRAGRDALLLGEETDVSLQELIDAPVGEVSETTRELARLELVSRGVKAHAYAGEEG